MKLFIVLCIVIVPNLGQMILPIELEIPFVDDLPTEDSVPPLFSPRVVNGKLATATQFPWHVSIQPLDTTINIRCSGSLITSNRVLTAAHCVHHNSLFEIGFGSVNINTPQNIVTVNRASIIIHPRYNNETLNNDIAVIKLDQDVLFTTQVNTIRLPRREESRLDYFANQVTFISGWGRTNDNSNLLSDMLQFTNLNITTNAHCRLVYGSSVVVNSTLCGIGIPISSGPCGGDSGSPLALIDVDGVATQIGLFSFVADLGCSHGYPAGFTNIASHLDWISQSTGIPIREDIYS